ncbi:hypothetical protein A4D02_32430 [Niastella koreensis]|uniref:Uncharacterized protein n=2 Tax=Niastella koreensis TaxID=354356 RepID=G8TC17_NIAKG|nr:hypothetical protein [Niastella koreensis]AEV99310.1 hypothetical protein Niako_2980 [Niastella koreensis GR20-10]OQP46097.1 hypothetical protein A4D02_32430 [Niastella koreensis]
MQLHELIGKKITNIYQWVEYEYYGVDYGECVIELDNNLIIEFPFDHYKTDKEVYPGELSDKAVSLFKDLSDIAFYHLDKDGKPIPETKKEVTVVTYSFWQRVQNFLLYGEKPVAMRKIIKKIQSYKADYIENKCKYIKDSTITDVLFFGTNEKAWIELDNGYLITEVCAGMNGTGRVGVHIHKNLVQLIKDKGWNFIRFSEQHLPAS